MPARLATDDAGESDTPNYRFQCLLYGYRLTVVGKVPAEIASELVSKLGLRRAVETGSTGDSGSLLKPAKQPTFYWLDAHWSAGVTAEPARSALSLTSCASRLQEPTPTAT